MSHSDVTGDLSSVDERVKDHFWEVLKILNEDKDDIEMGYDLKAYVRQYLNPYPQLFSAVQDLLVEKKILTRAGLKAYLQDVHPDYDPTPYCFHCGAMRRQDCDCGPLAEHD